MLFHYFERFLAEYESRFEREYGFLRPIIKEVMERYVDCGNPRCRFARIRCPNCGEERLLTKLDPEKFIRVNRAFIINFENIASIHRWFGGVCC